MQSESLVICSRHNCNPIGFDGYLSSIMTIIESWLHSKPHVISLCQIGIEAIVSFLLEGELNDPNLNENMFNLKERIVEIESIFS